MTNYFNPETSVDPLDETILGALPSGFVDFNKPKYSWSAKLYDLMTANTWFPSEVNTSAEGKNFLALTENEQQIYKLTFAQLSFNDSIQESYLLDFRRHLTNNVLKSTLTQQAYQESNHSRSYAVLLDATGNSEEVFNLYKTNDKLREKNTRIADQFGRYIEGTTSDKLLLSSIASVNLEGIYFLLGFSYIYLLGDKVPGARDMIQLIARDELNTHLPLFANIFKTIRRENNIDTKTVEVAYKMMEEAVKIELDYGKYLLESYPILGVTTDIITDTVENYANERLKAIGLEPLYKTHKETYLQTLVTKHNKLNEVRSNFFESNVKNYAKASVNLDDF